MRVWSCSWGCPTNKYPTNGIFQFDQARALKQQGVEVVFLAVDLRSFRKKRKWGVEQFVKDGILVYVVNIPLGPVGEDLLTIIGRIAFEFLAKKVKGECGTPDIVHAHFADTAFWVADYCQKNGIPFVITEHSSRYSASQLPEKIVLKTKNAYEKADKIITVSEKLGENIKELIGVESICIPNIVDLSVFNAEWKSKEKDYFEFVSAGNLIEWKRMHLVIKAVARLHRENINVKLIIFGGGPQRAELEHLIEELGIESQVELRGLVERSVMAEEYACADAFVLASKSETFGVAYIEAMAAGLPVVSTQNGGSSDFVRDFNGIMVPVDDEEELYVAMKCMIENIKQYDSKKIRDYVVEKFSGEVVAKKILEVYADIDKNSD